MESFGKRIKQLRIAAGFTQEKLAEKLGVAVKTIQRYENNYRPDTYVLVKLATFFGVTTDYLLGLKGYIGEKEELERKYIGNSGYNELYVKYLECLNDWEITENAEYYWIELYDDYFGGQTQWAGWTNESRTKEIRRLRPVEPLAAIKVCTKVREKPLVLNSEADANIFLLYGGQAIVREDICKLYLPEFWKDYVVENEGGGTGDRGK